MTRKKRTNDLYLHYSCTGYMVVEQKGLNYNEHLSASTKAIAFTPDNDLSMDAQALYLRDVVQTPLLTHQQVIQIYKSGLNAPAIIRNENGSTDDCATNLDVLVKSNQRLILKHARPFSTMFPELSLLDLVQEGNIGLVTAARKFDITKGNQFSTYATWWIRKGITRAVADQGGAIRIPVRMQDLITKSKRIREELQAGTEGKPTDEEMEEKLTSLGHSESAIAIALTMLEYNPVQTKSLDAPHNDYGLNLHDVIAAPDDNTLENAEYRSLGLTTERLLTFLPKRYVGIMLARNAGRTIEEIGFAYNISKERVRQIDVKAKEYLRNSKKFKQAFAMGIVSEPQTSIHHSLEGELSDVQTEDIFGASSSSEKGKAAIALIDRIFDATSTEVFGMTSSGAAHFDSSEGVARIKSRQKDDQTTQAKQLVVYLLQKAGLRFVDIARILHLHPSTIVEHAQKNILREQENEAFRLKAQAITERILQPTIQPPKRLRDGYMTMYAEGTPLRDTPSRYDNIRRHESWPYAATGNSPIQLEPQTPVRPHLQGVSNIDYLQDRIQPIHLHPTIAVTLEDATSHQLKSDVKTDSFQSYQKEQHDTYFTERKQAVVIE